MRKMITEYPIFGKQHLVADPLNPDSIGYKQPGSIGTSYPAISGPCMPANVNVQTTAMLTVFSSGCEYSGWREENCDSCARCKDDLGSPAGLRGGGCALELRLAIAYLDDGKVPFKTIKRIGYTDITVAANGGVFAHLTACKEFIPIKKSLC